MEEVAASLKTLKSDIEVLTIKTDVTVEADVANIFDQVQKAFGRPADVVISNAGALSDALPIGKTNPTQWWKSLVSTPLSRDLAVNCWNIFRIYHDYYILKERQDI